MKCYNITMKKYIPGYEGLYEITTEGEVFSLNYHREHIRKRMIGKMDKDGYIEVGLRKDGRRTYRRVHRLVALTFLPNPNNLPQINHKNLIKSDNSLGNLEWCTHKENIQHFLKNGIMSHNQRGQNNNYSKLKNKDVAQIWKLKGIKPQRELADMFNTTIASVGLIHRQRTWKWLTDTIL